MSVKCTDSRCDEGLHCFKFHSRKMQADEKGHCRTCKVSLVDWERVHKRFLDDVAYTFDCLRLELIRHHNWHIPFDNKALKDAEKKGKEGLLEVSERRLEKYLAPANNSYDGRQTPFEGSVVFYAQHSTATCCRTCLSYWHGIPKGRELTSEEISFCRELIKHYIEERLPELPLTAERSMLSRMKKL